MERNIKNKIPIILDAELTCPFPELLELLDGFNTMGEIIELLANEKRYVPEKYITDFICNKVEEGKIVWRDEWSPLHWCTNCNLPLLQDRCGKCHSQSKQRIDLKFPCNPRPIIPHDEFMFKSVGLPWPLDYSMVLNHYIRPNYLGWELIYSGKHIGDITYPFRYQNFAFHPAPAYNPQIFKKNSKNTMDDLIRANYSHLTFLEQEAIDFIKKWCKKYRFTIPVANFSGGKDSTVLIHICSLTKIKMQVAQVDTGIDPIQNVECSDKLLSRYPNLKLRRMSSKDLFWRAMEKLGPPARDFKWCRDILKTAAPFREERYTKIISILKHLRFLIKPTIILIEGTRRREEPERVPWGRVSKIPEKPVDTIAIKPTFRFTDLDIWMYIHLRRLPIHPTYTKEKNQRLICLYCPGKTQYELSNFKKNHPKLWNRFERELLKWRSRFKFSREWVSKNLWFYDQPIANYMRQLGIKSRISMISNRLNSGINMGEVQSEEDHYVVYGTIRQRFSLKKIKNWLSMLGKVNFLKKDRSIEIKSEVFYNIGTSISKRRRRAKRAVILTRISKTGEISMISQDKRRLSDFKNTLRLWITTYLNCVGCGACRAYSKYISLRNNKVFIKCNIKGRCNQVDKILQNCPVNEEGIKKFLIKPKVLQM